MKKISFIIIILVALIYSCEKPVIKGEYGNPLLRFYGSAKEDIAYSIAETDNGYVICGKLTIVERGINEAGQQVIIGEDQQFAIIKTRKDGIEEWVYTTGEPGFDEARAVLVLADGSIVCAGTASVEIEGKMQRDVKVVKLTAGGELVWEAVYGDEQNLTGEYFDQEGYDIIEDPLGNGFMIVGSDMDDTRGNNSGKRNMYILTLDTEGRYLASYSPGFPDDEYARSVCLTRGGYFLVAGTTEENQSDTPAQDGYNIITYCTSFNQLNQTNIKVYGGESDEFVTDVVLNGSGNAIVGTREYGTNMKEGIFVNFDMIGDVLPLSLSFASFDLGSNVVKINCLLHLPYNGFVLSGNTGGTDGSADMFFMFLDNEGIKLAEPETFISGGTGLQSVNDAIIDSDGKIVAVGINSYENNSLAMLIKFDPWK